MIKVAVIISYILMKGFDVIVDHIKDKYSVKELPENVMDVYDEVEYKKWRSYKTERGKLDCIKSLITITVMTILLVLNAYAWVFENKYSGLNIYLQYMRFAALITILAAIEKIPFSYYDTFVIAEKYGFNKTTKKTFVQDSMESILWRYVITYLVTVIIIFVFETFGNMAIIIATAILMIILLVVSFISVPPMRIFSEFEPLEEGKLRTRLVEMCDKYGMTIKKIFVMYTGMRINKSNALCTGVGKKRTILLDYNLINKYEIDEIVALFVRELAHVKFRHTAKSLSFKILRILIIITGFKLVLDYPAFYSEFGFTEVNYLWAQMVLMFCIWPLSKGLDAVSNYISRKHEYQADAFAAKEGYGEKLISSLKRLEKESLSDVNPHPLNVLLNYSHPTLSQRISAIENVKERYV